MLMTVDTHRARLPKLQNSLEKLQQGARAEGERSGVMDMGRLLLSSRHCSTQELKVPKLFPALKLVMKEVTF